MKQAEIMVIEIPAGSHIAGKVYLRKDSGGKRYSMWLEELTTDIRKVERLEREIARLTGLLRASYSIIEEQGDLIDKFKLNR